MFFEVYERFFIVFMKFMYFFCLELDCGVDCVIVGIKEKVMESRFRRVIMEKVVFFKVKFFFVNLY